MKQNPCPRDLLRKRHQALCAVKSAAKCLAVMAKLIGTNKLCTVQLRDESKSPKLHPAKSLLVEV
jgi:hypothetical protein